MTYDLQPHYAKYIIHLNMFVDGIVEKHDIIGAIFGQLDGLLPSEMDLQELQRIGKIDRILVKLNHKDGKTYAQILIPCNMSKLEIAILAAALETIDRVGPSRAETYLVKIEDIRKQKREKIVKRAVEILKNWDELVFEGTEDLVKKVEEEARKVKLVYYGPEKLPAGSGVYTSDEIIIVEGRADVLNLLRYGYDNAIAIEGTKVPQSVIELSKKKIATAFVDGDRSGLLILKELLQVADIDYIARAPKGKEVEELSGKEIRKALSRRIPINNLRLDLSMAVEDLEAELDKAFERKEKELKEKKEFPIEPKEEETHKKVENG